MNTQITKNKNTSANNSLQNRVLRLEKMLGQLLQPANGLQPENTEQNDQLSDLILSAGANNSPVNVFQSTILPVKNSIDNSGSGSNNIALSRSQIIAELALAITRASQRNS